MIQPMPPAELAEAMEAIGLTVGKLGGFFGNTRVTGYRWLAVGPPPAVAKMLRYMIAANLTAGAVNQTLEANNGHENRARARPHSPRRSV